MGNLLAPSASRRWACHLAAWTTLLVLCLTLCPFDFRPDAAQPFDLRLFPPRSLFDWGGNVALFLPLGFGLAAMGGRVTVLLAAGGLSATVEVLQTWLPRQPGLSDILSNIAGAFLGDCAFRVLAGRLAGVVVPWIRARRAGITRRGWYGLIAVWVLTLVSLNLCFQRRPDLSNWDVAFPLLVGNERTGDRPWRGQVFRLWVSNRPLAADVAARLLAGGASPETYASFEIRGTGPWPDAGGTLPSLVERSAAAPAGADRELQEVRWLETEAPVSTFARELQRTNQFTLGVEFSTSDLSQRGPARIVSISEDPYRRNLTLGQVDQDLIVRLRTSVTGENGTRPALRLPRTLARGKRHVVLLSWHAGVLRAWVDEPPARVFEISRWPAVFGARGNDQVTLAGLKLGYFVLVFGPLGLLLAPALARLNGPWWARFTAGAAGSILAPLGSEGLLAWLDSRPFHVGNWVLGAEATAFGLALALFYGRTSRNDEASTIHRPAAPRPP